MTKAKTLVDPVVVAAQELVLSLRRQMLAAEEALEVDGALAKFRDAAGEDAAAVVEPIVRRQSAQYLSTLEAARTRMVSRDLAAAGRITRLEEIVLAAVYLATADDLGRLSAAQDQLDTAEQSHAEALTDLDGAVQRADIPQILRLRTEAEAVLPQRVAEAKAALLEVQADQAEAALAGPTAAHTEAETAVDVARGKLEAAQRAAQQAEQQVVDARWTEAVMASVVHQMREASRTLAEERDAHTAQSSQAQQAMMRRLAGLEAS